MTKPPSTLAVVLRMWVSSSVRWAAMRGISGSRSGRASPRREWSGLERLSMATILSRASVRTAGFLSSTACMIAGRTSFMSERGALPSASARLRTALKVAALSPALARSIHSCSSVASEAGVCDWAWQWDPQRIPKRRMPANRNRLDFGVGELVVLALENSIDAVAA